MEPTDHTDFAPSERKTPAEIEADAVRLLQDETVEMVLHAMPNVFLVLNPQRQIILANRILAKVVGVDQVEVLYGKRPGEVLGCIHAADHAGGCGASKHCSACGAVHAILNALDGSTCEEECRIEQKQTGKIFELRVFATPFTFDSGQYVFFAINDIEAEKRRKALERIFFHDVMNTIHVLVNIAEVLPKATGAQRDEIIPLLKPTANQLLEEVQAYKALLSAEHNELIPQCSICNPAENLLETVGGYREAAQERGITIATFCPSMEVLLYTDPLLLKRILGNLLKNAIEASGAGDTLGVGYVLLPENRLRFFVQNPSIMPLSTQYQIFQRSFSTKGNGRGLGTYSVKLLAERFLGGQVSFLSSQDNGGTSFFVDLPLKALFQG